MIFQKADGDIEFYLSGETLCLAADINGMSENLSIDFELDSCQIDNLIDYLQTFRNKPVELIETYKVKVLSNFSYRDRDHFTQVKKKVYESKSKFMRYGKDIYLRHSGTIISREYKTECYQMGVDGKWHLIDTPIEFLN